MRLTNVINVPTLDQIKHSLIIERLFVLGVQFVENGYCIQGVEI